MSIWINGISAFMNEWQLVTVILVFVILGQILIALFLRNIFGTSLTFIDYFSLGLSGWLLPASLI